VLTPSVGGENGVTDYFTLVDRGLHLLVNAVKQGATF
jgi:hypothetical protein